jgi:hypothetical protein
VNVVVAFLFMLVPVLLAVSGTVPAAASLAAASVLLDRKA